MLIKYLIIGFVALFFNSCAEKDDKDFIIDYLKIAKKGDLNCLKKYLSYESQPKEMLDANIEYLIEEMKDAKIPEKDKIENIIDNGNYQTYSFILYPKHTECMIGLLKINKTIKIVYLGIIKKPVLHKVLP